MSLLATLERLATIDFAPVRLDADRCVRAHVRQSACNVCARACAFNAVRLNTPASIDAGACVACGQCIHGCPVGAIRADDVAIEVFAIASSLNAARVVELACSQHPAPQHGPAETDAVIRVPGCLASLGPSAYLSLLALGIERIVARLDGCAECPIGKARTGIECTLSTAQRLLGGRGEVERVIGLTDRRGEGWKRRRVRAPGKQASRRDFLRKLAGEGQQIAARKLAIDLRPASSGGATARTPPLERRRLLDALAQLPPRETIPETPLTGLPFARMVADETCTACGVCARICPTGALQFVAEDERYQLTFASGACTDCSMCLHVCMPGALHREDAAPADLISPPIVLRSGSLQSCAKCGAKFAGGSNVSLCPVCDFRRKNPFGSRLPPGAADKGPAAASRARQRGV